VIENLVLSIPLRFKLPMSQ